MLQIADPATNQLLSVPGSNRDQGTTTVTSISNSENNNPEGGGDPAAALVLDEDALRKRNEQIWEDEWQLIDSHRRGRVTYDELWLFLRSCVSVIPSRDLLRFVEMYGEPVVTSEATGGSGNDEDEDVFVLTKAGFIKFRREYTEKDVKDSEQELSSGDDEEDEDDETDGKLVERTARGSGNTTEAVDGEPDSMKKQQQWRRATNDGVDGDHTTDSSRSQSSSLRDGIVVDPGALDQSDASDLDEDDNDNGDMANQSGANLLLSETNAGDFVDD